MKPHRLKLTHHLILNYDLHLKIECYRPHQASEEELSRFHSDDYVRFLQTVSPSTARALATTSARYNMGESLDCPIFDGLFNYCQSYAGASIDAAGKYRLVRCFFAMNSHSLILLSFLLQISSSSQPQSK